MALSAYDNFIIDTYGPSGLNILPHYFPMNEASGNCLDAIGSMNGSIVDAVTQGAAGFLPTTDGETSYSTAGGLSALVVMSPGPFIAAYPMTFEAWVYPTGFNSAKGTIIAQGNATGTYLSIYNDAIITLTNLQGGFQNVWDTSTMSTDTAYHIVMTSNGTGAGTLLYLNGELQDHVNSGTPQTPAVVSPIGVLMNYSGSADGFLGSIAKVGTYSAALTQAQVLANYDAGLNGPPVATSYTASISPSTGTPPTTATITYTLNGILATNVNITPFVSDVYGSCSPNPVTINAGATVGTTTYSVSAEGTSTVTSTNNQSLSDPAGVNFLGSTVDTAGAITKTAATDTTLSFTATDASGSASYTYQWYRRLHNTGDYAAIGGATTRSPFVDTGLSASTAYDYALVYTNLSGARVVAFLSNVTTDATLVAGAITETGHTTTTLSFTATNCTGGTPSYTYQWARRLHGSGSYVNIGGATSLTLNDTGLTAGTAYDYQLTYTDAVSNTATAYALNVSTDTAVVAGTISTASKTTTTLAFSATNATGGTGTYTYQWGYRLHGGGAYSNFGTSSLTASLTGLTAGTAYDIQLVYTDTDTNTATATLSNVSTDSTITAGTITAGTVTPTTIPLTATNATGGTGTYTYQWGYRLHGIGSYVNFGTSSLTQTLTGLSPSTAYDVKLVYTDTDSNTATATLLNVSTLASSMIDTGQFQSSIGIGAWR